MSNTFLGVTYNWSLTYCCRPVLLDASSNTITWELESLQVADQPTTDPFMTRPKLQEFHLCESELVLDHFAAYRVDNLGQKSFATSLDMNPDQQKQF